VLCNGQEFAKDGGRDSALGSRDSWMQSGNEEGNRKKRAVCDQGVVKKRKRSFRLVSNA